MKTFRPYRLFLGLLADISGQEAGGGTVTIKSPEQAIPLRGKLK